MMEKTIKLSFKVPTKLSDLTLGQLQRFRQVTDQVGEKSQESEDFIKLKALEIFCGLELKESYKLPLSTFDSLVENINKVLAEPTPLVHRFTFRGTNGVEVEFGMQPRINEIPLGEFGDLDEYMKDFSFAHRAMAVLFRPIINSYKDMYEIEEYESSDKYADYMLHMPANVALGAMVFFYLLGMKLSNHTILYSLQQMSPEERLRAESRFLEQNGVGINQFTLSLEEISSNLMKLRNFQSISV